jgi:hypothetical protein
MNFCSVFDKNCTIKMKAVHNKIIVSLSRFWVHVPARTKVPFCYRNYYRNWLATVECIVEKSRLEDHIVVMGDFNLPKISWVDFDDFGLSRLGVTTDLEAKLVDGLINCD